MVYPLLVRQLYRSVWLYIERLYQFFYSVKLQNAPKIAARQHTAALLITGTAHVFLPQMKPSLLYNRGGNLKPFLDDDVSKTSISIRWCDYLLIIAYL